jgi:hypothetical protein
LPLSAAKPILDSTINLVATDLGMSRAMPANGSSGSRDLDGASDRTASMKVAVHRLRHGVAKTVRVAAEPARRRSVVTPVSTAQL